MKKLIKKEIENISGGVCYCFESKDCSGNAENINHQNLMEKTKNSFLSTNITINDRCDFHCCDDAEPFGKYQSYRYELNNPCILCSFDYEKIIAPTKI